MAWMPWWRPPDAPENCSQCARRRLRVARPRRRLRHRHQRRNRREDLPTLLHHQAPRYWHGPLHQSFDHRIHEGHLWAVPRPTAALFSSSRCRFVRKSPMPEPRPTIFVVDDDASVATRSAIFSSQSAFRRGSSAPPKNSGMLPGRTPPAACSRCPASRRQRHRFPGSARKGCIFIPIIFITAHGDVPMTSRAMKAGAIEFLLKPFQKEDLLAAIDQGWNAIVSGVKKTRKSLLSRTVSATHLPRTGSDGPGGHRPDQQADRRPARIGAKSR